MGEINLFGKNGLSATVYIGIRPVDAGLIALALFIGIGAALGLYAKAFR